MAKRTINKLENNIKKSLTPKLILVLVLLFVVGGVAGFFTFKHICRNDVFVLNGDKTITLSVGDEYVEQKAKCIAFGKDLSDKVKIDGQVDTTQEGEYTIVYTIDNLKYGKIRRVRVVIVEVAV